jgi:hypothetical protein
MRVRASIPGEGARNGVPTGGYRRFGVPGWDPARGVHLDPSVVQRAPVTMPAKRAAAAARRAEYFEARDLQFTRAEAAELVGIGRDAAKKYEQAYLERRAAGGAP